MADAAVRCKPLSAVNRLTLERRLTTRWLPTQARRIKHWFIADRYCAEI